MNVSPAAQTESRIASIDLIRGAAMILMAIDHVRVYSGLPAGGSSPGIFFTRWVTHFCAPAFIFLAGTSAYFYGRRHADLVRHLVIRGIWLIFLELTFLRVAWTFNFEFGRYELAGVIWAIGWCMIILAALSRLPLAAVGAIGVGIIAAHNLIDRHLADLIPALSKSSLSGLWKILYFGFSAGPIRIGANGPRLLVLYSIVPWIGVMAAGYAFGRILTLEPSRRNRICLAIGIGATLLFLILRGMDGYGDPRPWRSAVSGQGQSGQMPGILAFLNTNKYPASLDFLLMTLGPVIALIPACEAVRGSVGRWISIYGRVPFFFYLLHIPLIHVMAIFVSRIRLGEVSPWLFADHPMGNPPPPAGYSWSLPLLYLVWAATILILYPPCLWFARIKVKSRNRWLTYF